METGNSRLYFHIKTLEYFTLRMKLPKSLAREKKRGITPPQSMSGPGSQILYSTTQGVNSS
jgi:hypothetical protein